MKKLMLTCAAITALSGCTTLPNEAEVKAADYGEFPDNYEAVIKDYFSKVQSDPDSTTYKGMTQPKRYWLGNELDGVYYGYLVCVTYNTKNLFGVYSGYRTDAIMIKDDEVTKQVGKGDWWGEQLCD